MTSSSAPICQPLEVSVGSRCLSTRAANRVAKLSSLHGHSTYAASAQRRAHLTSTLVALGSLSLTRVSVVALKPGSQRSVAVAASSRPGATALPVPGRLTCPAPISIQRPSSSLPSPPITSASPPSSVVPSRRAIHASTSLNGAPAEPTARAAASVAAASATAPSSPRSPRRRVGSPGGRPMEATAAAQATHPPLGHTAAQPPQRPRPSELVPPPSSLGPPAPQPSVPLLSQPRAQAQLPTQPQPKLPPFSGAHQQVPPQAHSGGATRTQPNGRDTPRQPRPQPQMQYPAAAGWQQAQHTPPAYPASPHQQQQHRGAGASRCARHLLSPQQQQQLWPAIRRPPTTASQLTFALARSPSLDCFVALLERWCGGELVGTGADTAPPGPMAGAAGDTLGGSSGMGSTAVIAARTGPAVAVQMGQEKVLFNAMQLCIVLTAAERLASSGDGAGCSRPALGLLSAPCRPLTRREAGALVSLLAAHAEVLADADPPQMAATMWAAARLRLPLPPAALDPVLEAIWLWDPADPTANRKPPKRKAPARPAATLGNGGGRGSAGGTVGVGGANGSGDSDDAVMGPREVCLLLYAVSVLRPDYLRRHAGGFIEALDSYESSASPPAAAAASARAGAGPGRRRGGVRGGPTGLAQARGRGGRPEWLASEQVAGVVAALARADVRLDEEGQEFVQQAVSCRLRSFTTAQLTSLLSAAQSWSPLGSLLHDALRKALLSRLAADWQRLRELNMHVKAEAAHRRLVEKERRWQERRRRLWRKLRKLGKALGKRRWAPGPTRDGGDSAAGAAAARQAAAAAARSLLPDLIFSRAVVTALRSCVQPRNGALRVRSRVVSGLLRQVGSRGRALTARDVCEALQVMALVAPAERREVAAWKEGLRALLRRWVELLRPSPRSAPHKPASLSAPSVVRTFSTALHAVSRLGVRLQPSASLTVAAAAAALTPGSASLADCCMMLRALSRGAVSRVAVIGREEEEKEEEEEGELGGTAGGVDVACSRTSGTAPGRKGRGAAWRGRHEEEEEELDEVDGPGQAKRQQEERRVLLTAAGLGGADSWNKMAQAQRRRQLRSWFFLNTADSSAAALHGFPTADQVAARVVLERAAVLLRLQRHSRQQGQQRWDSPNASRGPVPGLGLKFGPKDRPSPAPRARGLVAIEHRAFGHQVDGGVSRSAARVRPGNTNAAPNNPWVAAAAAGLGRFGPAGALSRVGPGELVCLVRATGALGVCPPRDWWTIWQAHAWAALPLPLQAPPPPPPHSAAGIHPAASSPPSPPQAQPPQAQQQRPGHLKPLIPSGAVGAPRAGGTGVEQGLPSPPRPQQQPRHLQSQQHSTQAQPVPPAVGGMPHAPPHPTPSPWRHAAFTAAEATDVLYSLGRLSYQPKRQLRRQLQLRRFWQRRPRCLRRRRTAAMLEAVTRRVVHRELLTRLLAVACLLPSGSNQTAPSAPPVSSPCGPGGFTTSGRSRSDRVRGPVGADAFRGVSQGGSGSGGGGRFQEPGPMTTYYLAWAVVWLRLRAQREVALWAPRLTAAVPLALPLLVPRKQVLLMRSLVQSYSAAALPLPQAVAQAVAQAWLAAFAASMEEARGQTLSYAAVAEAEAKLTAPPAWSVRLRATVRKHAAELRLQDVAALVAGLRLHRRWRRETQAPRTSVPSAPQPLGSMSAVRAGGALSGDSLQGPQQQARQHHQQQHRPGQQQVLPSAQGQQPVLREVTRLLPQQSQPQQSQPQQHSLLVACGRGGQLLRPPSHTRYTQQHQQRAQLLEQLDTAELARVLLQAVRRKLSAAAAAAAADEQAQSSQPGQERQQSSQRQQVAAARAERMAPHMHRLGRRLCVLLAYAAGVAPSQRTTAAPPSNAAVTAMPGPGVGRQPVLIASHHQHLTGLRGAGVPEKRHPREVFCGARPASRANSDGLPATT